MSTAGDFRRTVLWLPGDNGARRIDIGPTAQVSTLESTYLGMLRLGYISDDGYYAGSRCTAVVRVGDNGSLIGPLDVPFTLFGEQPCSIVLTPESGHQDEIRVIASVVPGYGEQLNRATYSFEALFGTVYRVPQWVTRVVTCGTNPAVFSYLHGGATIQAAVRGDTVRPVIADSIQCTFAGVVTYVY